MSNEISITRKEYRAGKVRAGKTLLTPSQWAEQEAKEKAQRAATKATNSLITDMRILKSLQKWERKSEQDGLVMMILTPLDGKSEQIPFVLGQDKDASLKQIGDYFKKVNALKEKYKGTGFEIAPSCKYRVDIYVAGDNITMAHRGFAEVSRNTLEHSTLFFSVAVDFKNIVAPLGAVPEKLPTLELAELTPVLEKLEAAKIK